MYYMGSTPTLEPSLQDVNASADSFTYRKHHTLPNACIGISELLTRTACAYAQIQNQGLEDLILVVHLAVLQVKKKSCHGKRGIEISTHVL